MFLWFSDSNRGRPRIVMRIDIIHINIFIQYHDVGGLADLVFVFFNLANFHIK